jgi:hypothetical protein
MLVRLFGGWEYSARLCGVEDFAAQGYAGGVPMGGDLPPPPTGADAPVLAVWALADAGTPDRPGTPLQRIQIVKVSLGAEGERVYDVAGNPANAASVDPKSCEPRGAGHASLCAVWRDPAFDPEQTALYYARVVENPSCRWNAFVCLEAGVDCSASVPQELAFCCDDRVPSTLQERAWTSPIWYTPEALGRGSSSGD